MSLPKTKIFFFFFICIFVYLLIGLFSSPAQAQTPTPTPTPPPVRFGSDTSGFFIKEKTGASTWTDRLRIDTSGLLDAQLKNPQLDGSNYLVNGGLEFDVDNDGVPNNWVKFFHTTGSVAQDSTATNVNGGVKSVKLTNGVSQSVCIASQPFHVIPTKSYTVNVDVLGNVTLGFNVLAYYYAADSAIGASDSTSNSLVLSDQNSSSTYATQTGSFTVPTGNSCSTNTKPCTQARLLICNDTASSTRYIDNARVYSKEVFGTISSANTSSGAFGSNTGGGNYSFPGNVGIGTTSPGQVLDIVGNAEINGYAIATGGIYGNIGAGASDRTIWAIGETYNNWGIFYNEGSPDRIEFKNAGTVTSAIALDSGTSWFNAGNVGIGTTAPGASLHVASSGIGSFSQILASDSTGDGWGVGFWSGASGLVNQPALLWSDGEDLRIGGGITDFSAGSGFEQYMVIKDGGNVGIGTTSPEKRLHVSGSSVVLSQIYSENTIASGSLAGGGFLAVSNDGAALASGDRLGYFLMGGYDGATIQAGAGMTAFANTTWSAGTFPTDLVFETTNTTSRTEKMRITGAGYVGIGTTVPGTKLHVHSGDMSLTDANNTLIGSRISGQVSQSGAGISQYNRGFLLSNLYFDGSNWTTSTITGAGFNDFSGMYFSNGGSLRFVTGSVGIGTTNLGADLASYTRMSILSGGNVGIGTTGPGEKLSVNGIGIFGGITSHTTLYTGFDTQTSNVLEVGGSTLQSTNAGWGNVTMSNNQSSVNGIVGGIGFANLNTGSTEKRLAFISGWTDGAVNSGLLQFQVNNAGTVGTVMTIKSTGNVGIGTTAPDAKLDIAGSSVFSGGAVQRYFNLVTANVAGAATGTLKITMPKTWSNTMMQIKINGYDYSTGKGAWELLISGYNYAAGTTWYYPTAEIKGTPPFTQVRLAHDGTYNVILLGATNTAWSYPKVTVSEFTAGYSNLTGWGSGWSTSFITDETGIVSIATPTIKMFVDASGNVGIGTTVPAAKLAIANNVATGFLDNYSEYQEILYDSGTAGTAYGFGIKGNTVVFNSGGGAYSFDKAGNATQMVIDTAGNVGIGTTVPGAALDVKGTHIAASSTSAPSVGTCGTSPTIAGNDTRGKFTVGSGTVTACTVTFASAYSTAPYCTVTPYGADAGARWFITSTSTTTLVVGAPSTVAGKSFHYICIQ